METPTVHLRNPPNRQRPTGHETLETVTSSVANLPFNILFQIFKECLAGGTSEYSVKLPLLMCKGWHQAAMDHNHLWSTLVMRSDGFKFCSLVPLGGYPSESLLDITITARVTGTPGEPTHDRDRLTELFFSSSPGLLGKLHVNGANLRQSRTCTHTTII